MAYDPDYLCGNPICRDVLAEQLEARKTDADEIERLRAALKLVTTSISHNAAIQISRMALGSVCDAPGEDDE